MLRLCDSLYDSFLYYAEDVCTSNQRRMTDITVHSLAPHGETQWKGWFRLDRRR